MRTYFCFFISLLITFAAASQIERKNRKPKIVGQSEIITNEEEAVTVELSDLQVNDTDDWWYPWGFTLKVYEGDHYTVANNTITPSKDFNGTLKVPVTVNDGDDDSDKYDLKVEIKPVNDVPVITGQQSLTTDQGEAITLQLSNLTVSDPDDNYPTGFTLEIAPSSNSTYTFSGNQVTPASDFVGMLTVSVRVNDGDASSQSYALQIQVHPGNSPPVIVGQASLTINEDESILLLFSHLTVTDPDNPYPNGFTLKISEGTNYAVSGNTIKPAADFSGSLSVNVIVNDGTSDSNTFPLKITVNSVNDPPVITRIEGEPLPYQAGKGPVKISEILEINDVDDNSLVSAEVGFNDQRYRMGIDELTFENRANIIGAFDLQRGILKLSGKAPVSDYAAAIRSIQYNFITALDPTFETKTLYILVNDGKSPGEKAERQIGMGNIIVSLDIPTAFTPNGDFANDTWSIKPLKQSDELSRALVRIYNKAGQLLFEAFGFDKEWDGRLNGELLPADTYFYTIDLNVDYSKTSFKGIVAILR